MHDEKMRSAPTAGCGPQTAPRSTDEPQCFDPVGQNLNKAYRMSARSAIQSRVAEMRKRADDLERISNALPKELSNEVDEALWSLVTSVRI